VNGNYNFLLNNAEPLNTLFTIEAGESATDSIIVKRNDTDIKFVIDGIEKGVVADDYAGFSLRHLKTAVVERIADNKYKVTCNCYPFIGSYSPLNLYTESSAVNVDNYAASIGSWDQFQSSPGDITATTDNSGFGQGSIRFLDASPNLYSQIFLEDYMPTGYTASTPYKLRFRYKYLQGGAGNMRILMGNTTSDEGIVIIDSTPNPSDTYAANGIFEYDFVSDAVPTAPLIRIYGNHNASGVPEEFYIADFEIVPNP
jgi:hypothetical protein